MKPYNTIQTFAINIGFHIVILFTLLSLIFIFYISGVIKKSLDGEIQEFINYSLLTFLTELTPQQMEQFKAFVSDIPFDEMIPYFSQPAEDVTRNNNWLMLFIIFTACVLVVFIITICAIIKYHCGYHLHLARIIIINIIIFTFVGIIELLFFNFIISQYVPVLPSTMINTLFSAVRNMLKYDETKLTGNSGLISSKITLSPEMKIKLAQYLV